MELFDSPSVCLFSDGNAVIGHLQVYDNGTVFTPDVLDMTADEIRDKFMQGVRNLAAVCLAIGHPTLVSVPHSLANGLKNLLAIAVETDIELKEAQKVGFSGFFFFF